MTPRRSLFFQSGETFGLSERLISCVVMHPSSWNMSEDDLDIWERLFEQGLLSVKTSIEHGDVVDDIASRCPSIGPRYETIPFVLRGADVM